MSGGDLHPREVADRAEDVQLLDVREPAEWVAGHVHWADHVPMGQLHAQQDRLATDRTIAVICRSGNRSAAVANALRRAGYDAVNVLGGMHAWSADGLPFVAEGDAEPYVA